MSDDKRDSRQILGDRVRTLEDDFFRREDDRLVQRLLDLGIRPEIVGAIAVIPLAEVAWADGTLDDREKRAIIARAEKSGVPAGSTGHDLLQSWLEHKPEPKLLTSWIHMVQGICEQMTAEQVAAVRAGLVERTQTIAKASGGLLGVGAVSAAEAEMIKRLESAFRSPRG